MKKVADSESEVFPIKIVKPVSEEEVARIREMKNQMTEKEESKDTKDRKDKSQAAADCGCLLCDAFLIIFPQIPSLLKCL